jgi:hypothetical protein
VDASAGAARISVATVVAIPVSIVHVRILNLPASGTEPDS